jgi:hypothetical protein
MADIAALRVVQVATSFDHVVREGEHLTAMVIQAARLAAILLRIARGLRLADRGSACPYLRGYDRTTVDRLMHPSMKAMPVILTTQEE